MKIIIFISSISHSKPAILFGGLIARVTRSPITLLMVSRSQVITDHFLEGVGEFLQDVTVTTQIKDGTPVASILNEINNGGYDLVVLNARQALSLKEQWGKKVGRQIARQSPISVLVVKQEWPNLQRILICTRGQKCAEPVVEIGALIAQAAQAQATLLYVTSPVPSMYTGLTQMDEALPDLLQTVTPVSEHLHWGANILRNYHVDAKINMCKGSVANEILYKADSGDYDLIVLGASKTRLKLAGWIFGDVTQQIVDQAHCPVLVVREKQSSSKEKMR